ncbi:complement C1q-like protein 4 [Amphiura filiformis]|uniref:complement C1q-like protein 4 n=1 Tax=Amphiura filiformis TaxID=82378 RepID=UPI003B21A6FE
MTTTQTSFVFHLKLLIRNTVMPLKGKKIFKFFLFTTTCFTTITCNEDHQPLPCNNCCQGPVGIQGQPAFPVFPVKWNTGQSRSERPERRQHCWRKRREYPWRHWSTGEKGDVGSPVRKGQPGMTASRGPFGFKGQKGEIGRARLSAFSAVRSSSFIPRSDYQPLPFEDIHNNIGDDFDAGGRFTCEIAGIYLFMYSVGTYSSNPHVSLMKNDVKINTVYRSDEGLLDIVSSAAVLQLHVGDQVWLRCRDKGREIYSNSDQFTTFSGAILHET